MLYVGFVPVSDVLAIFVADRRCEFSSNFSFVIKKKHVLVCFRRGKLLVKIEKNQEII